MQVHHPAAMATAPLVISANIALLIVHRIHSLPLIDCLAFLQEIAPQIFGPTQPTTSAQLAPLAMYQ